MLSTYRNGLIAAGVILLLAGGIYLQQKNARPQATSVNSNGSATTTISVNGGAVEIVGPEGVTYTLNEVDENAPAAPNYRMALKFDASVSPEVKTALNINLANVQDTLSKNPQSFEAWLELGRLRKIAGDYKGAAEIWEYVSLAWPTNSVSVHNLGDLYMNFIKDYPKAEANFKKEIANEPHAIAAYQSLYVLYQNFYKKGTSAARDIVALGLKNNPNNSALLALKAELDAGQ